MDIASSGLDFSEVTNTLSRQQSAAYRRESDKSILVADFDLFSDIGGGQSSYRAIIENNPQNTYYYFSLLERAEARRPPNAIPIAHHKWYGLPKRDLGDAWRVIAQHLTAAMNMAASVAAALGDARIDVVDTPDYRQTGPFLRHAFARHGIAVGTVALALHGTISSAFSGGWPAGKVDRRLLAQLRLIESVQFRTAEARYAISEAYAEHLQTYAPLPVNILDPLCIVGESEPTRVAPSAERPDLAFVGRREKRKGPDLFLDWAWWIGRERYNRLLLIGPDGVNHQGQGSMPVLSQFAHHRRLTFEIVERAERPDVDALLRGRTLVCLPSRYDQFNLVALEALRLACPVVVSEHAGIAPWLRQRFPEFPWLVADLSCSRTAAATARDILENYERYRDSMVDELLRRPLVPDRNTYATMYDDAPRDEKACDAVARIVARFELLNPVRRKAKSVPRRLDRFALIHDAAEALSHATAFKTLRTRLRTVQARVGALRKSLPKQLSVKRFCSAKLHLSPRTVSEMAALRKVKRQKRRMLRMPERTTGERLTKVSFLSTSLQSTLVDRVRTHRELIRLERERNDLIAATYCLRTMRWLGEDRFDDLPFVTRTLKSHGFAAEADTALAMFGDPQEATARQLALMNAQRSRNMATRASPLKLCDDRRGEGPFRVAVIVSLYNAEDKLRAFLDSLVQQSIARDGAMEVILVDSGSPTREYKVFNSFYRACPLPIVYARSAERETIQAAWNRGIRLATAPYLAFLGVDEAVHPDCFANLAKVLDEEPDTDWAMADSIVTSIGTDGIIDSDVMIYDRRGYRQDLVYLETCYLSWVGGLYRRSIHDRFGYYDETFRAAGDTEFKNRVMPFIRSRHVPRPYGMFNNYPDGRTTQHPRAEIEDLRAWYLWRTEAGMQYAFGDAPVDRPAQLFRDCLNYRKSFCGHLSTDFDLASSLARHLATRNDAPAFASSAMAEVEAMIKLFRSLELLDAPRGKAQWLSMAGQLVRTVKRTAVHHQHLFALDGTPHYEIFNDNRYEQHWWSWS